MTPNQSIGGISVSISVDLSGLSAQFTQAQKMAEQAGASIARAFSDSAGKMGDLSSGAGNLVQNLTNVQSAAVSASTGVSGLTSVMDPLSASLLKVAGIPLTFTALAAGVAELASASLEAFANLQRAEFSLTALTGSATQAQSEIAGLKKLAMDEALSFPELLQANQRLTALGVSADQIPAALKASANAAAAMNTSIINVTNAIDRMAASGSVAGRNLTQLGLTTNDLAKVMGVALNQVTKTFHGLDESERINVLTEALSKFAGVAEARAASLAGSFQRLENTATFALQEIGAAIAPAAKAITDMGMKIIPVLADQAGEFLSLSTSVTHFVQALGDLKPQAESLFSSLTGISPELVKAGNASGVAADSFRDALAPGVGLAKTAFEGLALSLDTYTGKGPAIVQMNQMIADGLHKVQTAAALGGEAFQSAWDLSKIQAGLGTVAGHIRDVIDAQEKANLVLNQAQEAFTALNDSFQKGTPLANGYVATQQEVSRAAVDLEKAQKAASLSTKELTDSMGADLAQADKLIGNVQRAQQAYDSLASSQDGSQRAAVALEIAQQNLTRTSDALAKATGEVLKAHRDLGPSFSGISKLLAEISGGMRLYEQQVTDASTGEAAYVTVVKSLSAAQMKSVKHLEELYAARAKMIDQGINTKAIDEQVKRAEDAVSKSFEEGMDAVEKHRRAVQAKSAQDRDGIVSAGGLEHAHRGLAAAMILSADQIRAGLQDESGAFQKALDVAAQLRLQQDGTAGSAIAYARALEQVANAARAAGFDQVTLQKILDEVKKGFDSSQIAASAAASAVRESGQAALSAADDWNSLADAVGAALDKMGTSGTGATVFSGGITGQGELPKAGDVRAIQMHALGLGGINIETWTQAQIDSINNMAQLTQKLTEAGVGWKDLSKVITDLEKQSLKAGASLSKLVDQYIASLKATSDLSTTAAKATQDIGNLATAVSTASSSSLGDLSSTLGDIMSASDSASTAMTTLVNGMADVYDAANAFFGPKSQLAKFAIDLSNQLGTVNGKPDIYGEGNAVFGAKNSFAILGDALPQAVLKGLVNGMPDFYGAAASFFGSKNAFAITGGNGPGIPYVNPNAGTPYGSAGGAPVINVTGNNITNQQAADQVAQQLTSEWRRTVGQKI